MASLCRFQLLHAASLDRSALKVCLEMAGKRRVKKTLASPLWQPFHFSSKMTRRAPPIPEAARPAVSQGQKTLESLNADTGDSPEVMPLMEEMLKQAEKEGNDWMNDTGITAADVLRVKKPLVQVQHISKHATIDEAISIFCNYRIASLLVHNNNDQVVGMFTARDVLREIHQTPKKSDAFKITVGEIMVPLSHMISCRPEHTLKQCHLIMKECKVRNLPVLADGQVMGILTIKDISDYSFLDLKMHWKKDFLKTIGAQKGVPAGMALGAKLHQSDPSCLSVGAAALPHPFKQESGIAFSRREFLKQGHKQYAQDLSLSEDAHFVLKVPWPHKHGSLVTYIGVADGVGSWRGLGIDPREYPQRLMHGAQQYILSCAPKPSHEWRPPLRPNEVLQAAWEKVNKSKLVGSCAACIVTLDHELHQLSFSNVGDTGIMVLRHVDAGLAGYMQQRANKKMGDHLKGGTGKGDNGNSSNGGSTLRITFLSQQRFRSFNLPYQLGYTNIEGSKEFFETPADADTTAYPVLAGDIIIIATDPLRQCRA